VGWIAGRGYLVPIAEQRGLRIEVDYASEDGTREIAPE
jgi:hypothetical protein